MPTRERCDVLVADQQLLRFEPLDRSAWLLRIGVAATAIVPNELHKRLRRKAAR